MLTNFDAEDNIEYLTAEIRKYFVKNGPQSKAIIGISGGKDSTITAALLVRALGKENVVGVLMPDGEQADLEDARLVCKILEIEHYEINIGSIMSRIDNVYPLKINDTILTNTPARIRMTILYMVAASIGGRVINTCNRSEEFVGYSTKYGDLAGDYGVLMDYTVSEIYALGNAMPELPDWLVHKTPVDGMCDKTDEENLGITYEAIDNFLLYGIMPEYEAYKNMMIRHERNLHKQIIRIPHPTKKENAVFEF